MPKSRAMPAVIKTWVILNMLKSAANVLKEELTTTEGDATWKNPRILWQYRLGWNQGLQRPLPFVIEGDDSNQRDLRARQASLEFEALMSVTQSVGRSYAAGSATDLIPESIKEKTLAMEEDERKQFLKDLFIPFTAGIRASGKGGSGRDGLIFEIRSGDRAQKVMLVFQICPFYYDHDRNFAYTPITLGLYPVAQDETILDFDKAMYELTLDEKAALWTDIFYRLNKYMTAVLDEMDSLQAKRQSKAPPPFFGILPLSASIDVTVLNYFQVAAGSRGIFRHPSDMRDLDQEVVRYSKELLESQGDTIWKSRGGIWKAGMHSLLEKSAAMGKLMVELTTNYGGFTRTSRSPAVAMLKKH